MNTTAKDFMDMQSWVLRRVDEIVDEIAFYINEGIDANIAIKMVGKTTLSEKHQSMIVDKLKERGLTP